MTEKVEAPAKTVDPDLLKGKALFKINCASCHNKNMTDDMTGPALRGVTKRWDDHPKADLYSWIKNSTALIVKGHPQAVAVGKKYEGDMNKFPNLSDEEIELLLKYIER